MTQQELLNQLQQIAFYLVDLNLYMDTHPDCPQGLALYNTYATKLRELRMQYEQAYGPLLNFGNMLAKNGFDWINSPWPWEN